MNEVEYLLVGGYSVNFYGYVRTTGDIDIWIRPSRKNGARVSAALAGYGFDAKDVPARLFQRKKKVLRIGVPPFRIDLFDGCVRRRIR